MFWKTGINLVIIMEVSAVEEKCRYLLRVESPNCLDCLARWTRLKDATQMRETTWLFLQRSVSEDAVKARKLHEATNDRILCVKDVLGTRTFTPNDQTIGPPCSQSAYHAYRAS